MRAPAVETEDNPLWRAHGRERGAASCARRQADDGIDIGREVARGQGVGNEVAFEVEVAVGREVLQGAAAAHCIVRALRAARSGLAMSMLTSRPRVSCTSTVTLSPGRVNGI